MIVELSSFLWNLIIKPVSPCTTLFAMLSLLVVDFKCRCNWRNRVEIEPWYELLKATKRKSNNIVNSKVNITENVSNPHFQQFYHVHSSSELWPIFELARNEKQMCPEIALAVFFTLAVRGNLTQAENEEKFERLWTNRVNLEIASL